MSTCVQVEQDGGGLRPVGQERDWQTVLHQAAAIRLVRDVDRAGLSLYEIDHADDGGTRRYLVTDCR